MTLNDSPTYAVDRRPLAAATKLAKCRDLQYDLLLVEVSPAAVEWSREQPMPNDFQAAKELICQIIAVAGGRLEGRVRLYKAFYYAHLFYWLRGQGVLTQQAIVRMPWGPGVHEGKSILEALQQEGKLRITSRQIGPYQEAVYELTSRFEINPSDPRYQAVEKAVEFVRDKSAVELSEETHLYSRSWRQAKDGEMLDIYADLLDDDECAQIDASVAEAEALVHAAF